MNANTSDTTKRLELAIEAAREAGQITLKYFRRPDLQVEQKEDDTPVTVADSESEEHLRDLAEHIDAIFWLSSADNRRVIYASPGFERIFARQVDAFVRSGDVLVGWSTSGTSGNVVAAFERAHALGATCVGSCGYGGRALAELATVDVTLAIDGQSVHRIQESQADVMDAVVAATAVRLSAAGGRPS